MKCRLKGVIAAIITPVDASGEPDHARLVSLARLMLSDGCDGLNLLGTTGEAVSFTAAQRAAVMEAVATAGLPLDRMMVGTGASAVGDAVSLTRLAGDLGFAGALLLPPFYYKPVVAEGLKRYIGAIAEATAQTSIPLYLYNFPALSGIQYTPEIVELLLGAFGDRIAGLKDSSGDLDYARKICGLSSSLAVFPSNEANLLLARDGEFAGCISATANLNHRDCGRAFHDGDRTALDRAVAVRAAFNGLPLVPGVKATLAMRESDESLATVLPPLVRLTASENGELRRRLRDLEFLTDQAT